MSYLDVHTSNRCVRTSSGRSWYTVRTFIRVWLRYSNIYSNDLISLPFRLPPPIVRTSICPFPGYILCLPLSRWRKEERKIERKPLIHPKMKRELFAYTSNKLFTLLFIWRSLLIISSFVSPARSPLLDLTISFLALRETASSPYIPSSSMIEIS